MFDEIDFLTTHTDKSRVRRKTVIPHGDVDLVRPNEHIPSWWENTVAYVRGHLHPPTVVPAIPHDPPEPIEARALQKDKENDTPSPTRLPSQSVQSVKSMPAVTASPAPSAVPVLLPFEMKDPKSSQVVPPVAPEFSVRMKVMMRNAMNGIQHRRNSHDLQGAPGDGGAEALEVNLLPQRERARAGYQTRVVIAACVMCGALVIMLGVALFIRLRTSGRERELQRIVWEIAEVERQMVQGAADVEESLAFQQRSRAVRTLLRQHTKWSSFLTFLESTTSRDVYYNRVKADRNGGVALQVNARNYNAAAEQLTSWMRDSRVRSVTLSPLSISKQSGVVDTEQVSFEATLTIDPVVIIPSPISDL